MELLVERLERAEMQIAEMRGESPDVVSAKEKQAEELLNAIVKGFQAVNWDARSNKMRQDSLLALGEPAFRMLPRVALKESSANIYRETAIRIMANSRQERFVEPLVQVIALENLPIQREALLALAKIGGEKAIHHLSLLRNTVPLELKDLTEELWQTLNKSSDSQKIPPLPAIQ